jgi:hypothetical protein
VGPAAAPMPPQLVPPVEQQQQEQQQQQQEQEQEQGEATLALTPGGSSGAVQEEAPSPVSKKQAEALKKLALKMSKETWGKPGARAVASLSRGVLAEIYLCAACSCHEILRSATARVRERPDDACKRAEG